MERNIANYIKKDLKKKIVLISGPRQTGKTTLSKLISKSYEYLNYDYSDYRNRIEKKEWDRKKEIIILDEIHKMNKWKSFLKGIYDVEGIKPALLVTGSAKLDTFRKVGDSLAGRYFSYRLYPFDLKELKINQKKYTPEENFTKLLEIGGFPEPFLEGEKDFYNKWKRTHLDIIIKQDLISIEKVTNIIGIENLVRLLRSRVGSTISYANLAGDLGVDPKTVKNWLDILEKLFVIFKVTPYSKKIKDSILKAPKYYFYDNGQVEGDNGVKLENLVAFSILKELHFLEDTKGFQTELNFLRTKKGEKIDFLISINNNPYLMVEVKWSDDNLSKNFFTFNKYLKNTPYVQVLGKIKMEKTIDAKTEIRSAMNWLSDIDFSL